MFPRTCKENVNSWRAMESKEVTQGPKIERETAKGTCDIKNLHGIGDSSALLLAHKPCLTLHRVCGLRRG